MLSITRQRQIPKGCAKTGSPPCEGFVFSRESIHEGSSPVVRQLDEGERSQILLRMICDKMNPSLYFSALGGIDFHIHSTVILGFTFSIQEFICFTPLREVSLMRKLVVVMAFAVIMIGCSITHTFIDVEDVLLLGPNMTKAMVLEAMGEPTMVRAGIVLASGDVLEVWRYRVKKMKARQQIDINGIFPPMFMPRQKPGDNWESNHWIGETDYDFIFKNGVLVKWGFPMDDWPTFGEESGEIVAPARFKDDKTSTTTIFAKIPIVKRFF